jgi:ribosomal protein S18 acetylase RimI-like enzyme
LSLAIRDFIDSDAEPLSNMLRESFDWFHKGNKESWLWKAFDPPNILSNSRSQEILVALDKQQEDLVVGYISSTNTVYGVAYVPTVAVRKSLKGRGIGKLLLEEKIRRLKEKGIRKVWLLVTSINTGAISFYLRNQFVIEGYLRDHTAPGYDEVLFSRFL